MKARISIPVGAAAAEPRLRIGGFWRVNNDLKALGGSRRDEIAREQVVLCPGYLERVLAAPITFAQPLSADRVRYIEQVKFVCHSGIGNQTSHPVAVANGVGGEI